MLNIVFFEPEIPYNTGAIARTCALTDTRLHLIKPLGFDIDEKAVRRAGLDYWPLVNLTVYESYEEFIEKNPNITLYLATTKGQTVYSDVCFKDEDFIMFGRESSGLPKYIMDENHKNLITIPMIPELKRSLNLANSANIILYEALRQLNFPFSNR